MTAKVKRFRVTVTFRSEGYAYGYERFTIRAVSRRAARELARKRAQGSQYNNDGWPDRQVQIELVEEH